MLFCSSKTTFFFLMLGGTILSVSSDSWFGSWCGLELNLMSFIPFISLKKDVYCSESSLKYFLVQALGSALVILGAVLMMVIMEMSVLLVSALLLKMGCAPLHFWFPHVMSGLSWLNCMVLMSLQKIAPMVLLSYLVLGEENSYVINLSAILSALVGSLGGLNQVFLRKIMAYSSINHMSWMLFALGFSESSWMMYFLFYVIISSTIVYMFYSQHMFHITQLTLFKWSLFGVMMFMSLLSLGGLPPFVGFIPKWLLIQEMVFKGLFFPLMFLLSGTLVSLYYYLRLALMSFSLSSLGSKWNKEERVWDTNKMSLFMVFNFMVLMIPSLFYF